METEHSFILQKCKFRAVGNTDFISFASLLNKGPLLPTPSFWGGVFQPSSSKGIKRSNEPKNRPDILSLQKAGVDICI